MAVHFVAVWVGEKYDRRYIETWLDMVVRHATELDAFSVWAITDRPDELPEGIAPIPANPDLPGWWQKCFLFSPDMPWAEGDRIIYLDLDVVICGRLEPLAERSGIIQDYLWPTYNSSVMSWRHGEHSAIWDTFTPDIMTSPGRLVPKHALPAGTPNGGDQEHVSSVSRWDVFPTDWFPSYRTCHGGPPAGCIAVILHGQPKPHEITEGWVPNIWRVGGWTALPKITGANVTYEQIHANVRSAVQRDLDWFSGHPSHSRKAVIVCGAPSMKDHIADIRWHARQGAKIISVNNAWRFLVANGVTPEAHIMLDARPENAAFLKDAPRETTYFLASQCHPDVFDAVADYPNVVVWHNGHAENETLREILDPWWGPGPDQKSCIIVPGGGTVGLRAIWMCAFSGIRTIHIYGMDSSYAASGEHHAYPQALNDGEDVLSVTMGGKTYKCARWMCRQAEEFRETWFQMKGYVQPDGAPAPVKLFVHGQGLVPDMARALRAAERAK